MRSDLLWLIFTLIGVALAVYWTPTSVKLPLPPVLATALPTTLIVLARVAATRPLDPLASIDSVSGILILWPIRDVVCRSAGYFCAGDMARLSPACSQFRVA